MIRKLCLVLLILSVSYAQKTSYSIASIEYKPVIGDSLKNVKNYEEIVLKITNPVDIIVFPEFTINYGQGIHDDDSTVVVQKDKVLCDSESEKSYLKNLSCIAKTKKSFLVVNLWEKVDKKVYNSDVIFDRTGKVVATYHKYNIYDEGVNKPDHADLVTFDTDFGKFGVFTCFDILFGAPPLKLVREKAIKHFVYPTMWYSEMPFLTALQAQQMWAQENDVILISANALNDKVGSGGSGIYVGKAGPIKNDFPTEIGPISNYNILLKDLPITDNTDDIKVSPPNEDIDNLATLMDNVKIIGENLKDYIHKVLNLEPWKTHEITVTHNGLKCTVTYAVSKTEGVNVENSKNYTYQMILYSGVRKFGLSATGGVENCGIVACLNEDVTSCGQRFPDYNSVSWPIKFESISVTATYRNDENHVQFPNSLLASIRPIFPEYTKWESKIDGKNVIRTHSLVEQQEKLLTFGIFGRNFNLDGVKDSKHNSSNVFYSNFCLVLSGLFLVFKLNNFCR